MSACGFYGKIPSQGDFVSRRLPWEFTSAWDDWLARGLQASREALGERWLGLYLSAPIWRFQVASGVCGPQGWRGLFFASVDRVGRHFPLTLACADPPGTLPSLPALSAQVEAWRALEDLALRGLTPTLAVDDFDRAVEAQAIPALEIPVTQSPASRVCLYTEGSEATAAVSLSLQALLPPQDFARLLVPASSPPSDSLIDLL